MAKLRGFRMTQNRELLASRVFRVHEETWRAPDGGIFTRQNIIHPGAVAILPITAKGTYVFIRQFRPAARDWILEIPAGTLEPGETPLACAKRELIEEIGFAARAWKKLGKIFTAPGFCTEQIHLFEATGLKPATAAKDEDEHIELAEMTGVEVRGAVKRGEIRDGKSLSALFLCGRLK